MKKVNSAVISAISIGTLAVSGATVVRAADLGGSCCADLESRVAELEIGDGTQGQSQRLADDFRLAQASFD